VSVVLGIQHAMRMRRIILSSVVHPALHYCSTLSHERHDFRGKKNIEHGMCVLIYSTNSLEKFLILRRIQRGIITTVPRCLCKVFVTLAV